MSEQQINAVKLQIEKAKLTVAKAKIVLLYQQFRPSMCLPVCVKRDGSQWLCIYESSENLLECPSAYGGSPAQAMLNFDLLWSGAGLALDLDPGEDEEEKY